MQIQFFGQSCFRLRGKESVLVTDPYESSVGLKLPKLSADIVVVSHEHKDHNFIEAVIRSEHRPEPFIIRGPGEYEVNGVFILGLAGKNTIYSIKMDGLNLVHLGDLGHPLNDDQLEKINGVDVLFLPVGEVYTLGVKEAIAEVAKIEPKIVIPMHYQLSGLKFNLAPVENFLEQMGNQEIKPIPKLLVSEETLPGETEIVVLAKR